MVVILKDYWKRYGVSAISVALGFAILFAAIRGVGMLGSQLFRPLIPLGFVMMMVLPFIFLRKEGRRQIGLTKSLALRNYVTAIVYGAIAASVCFVLGVLLFDRSTDNWFITIRNYYLTQVPGSGEMSLSSFFIIATIPALIFSPIGEEIFFRGFLQDALQTRFGLRESMVIESAMFGFVHLFHHGLVSTADGIQFYPLSGAIWVILMFSTAYLFALIRKWSGSIYPPIVAHAVFNLVMNVYIFYFLR